VSEPEVNGVPAADLHEVTLRWDEIQELGTDRCKCGHLYGLHNYHCCHFCMVGDCRCGND
jgi:hypothetical protein